MTAGATAPTAQTSDRWHPPGADRWPDLMQADTTNVPDRVSVVVPCYNYGRYLGECIKSVVTQQDVLVSVLIIDDGSSDDTRTIGAELSGADPRIEYRRHETNLGHIATYNEGLRWSDGDYTVLLSADDLLAPGALSRAARLFRARPDVVLVYGDIVRFSADHCRPPARVRRDARQWVVRDGQDWLASLCQNGVNYIAAPEAIVRTEVQRAVGGYREDLPHTADLEMWMRFATRGNIGRIVGADQAYVRVNATSMQRTRFMSPVAQLQQRQAAFDQFFREHGHRLPNADRLRRRANRTVSRDAMWEILLPWLTRRPSQALASELARMALTSCSATDSVGNPRAGRKIAPLGTLVGATLHGLWCLPSMWLRVRLGSTAWWAMPGALVRELRRGPDPYGRRCYARP